MVAVLNFSLNGKTCWWKTFFISVRLFTDDDPSLKSSFLLLGGSTPKEQSAISIIQESCQPEPIAKTVDLYGVDLCIKLANYALVSCENK